MTGWGRRGHAAPAGSGQAIQVSGNLGLHGKNMLTYYDQRLGRDRIKRRYTWAFWAFLAGIVLGAVVAYIL